jgi:hypothetical protein
MSFIAKTWNNGQYHTSGAGYGLKISFEDRERFFDRQWQTVILHLSRYPNDIEVNVAKASFWNRNCGELIKKDIGIWLQQNNLDGWPIQQPNDLNMTVIGGNVFRVEFTT